MDVNVGKERLKADMRQFGGMLLLLSTCITTVGLTNVVAGVGEGTNPSSGLPLGKLIGSLFLLTLGSLGMYVGFRSIISDWGNKNLTMVLCVIIQLAWVPFLNNLSAVGGQASGPVEGNKIVPEGYEPTAADVKFLGTMGILSVLAYASAFVGGQAFMAFSMLAYQSGKASDRTQSYYCGRLGYYSALVVIAGFSQFAAGCYIVSRFGGGALNNGQITAGMYIVSFPEISIFVGLVQFIVGNVGFARMYGKLPIGANMFQSLCMVMWICMLVLQIIVQYGYAPGDKYASMAPVHAMLFLSLPLTPAFLDWKMETAPEVIEPGYYEESEANKVDDEGEGSLEKVEAATLEEQAQDVAQKQV